MRQQRVVRDDPIDEAHRERFLGADETAGEEQITSVRHPDQAGQDPRAAVLGDQTAAREDEAEARAIGCETEVVVQHVRDTEPGGDAVHRRDDRLSEPERIAVLAAERLGQRRVRLDVQLVAHDVDALPALDSLEHVHVGAVAVALARPGDDDHAHRLVAIGAEGGVAHLGAEAHRPGVQLLGTVEGDRRDAIRGVVEDLLVVDRHEGWGSTGAEPRATADARAAAVAPAASDATPRRKRRCRPARRSGRDRGLPRRVLRGVPLAERRA